MNSSDLCFFLYILASSCSALACLSRLQSPDLITGSLEVADAGTGAGADAGAGPGMGAGAGEPVQIHHFISRRG